MDRRQHFDGVLVFEDDLVYLLVRPRGIHALSQAQLREHAITPCIPRLLALGLLLGVFARRSWPTLSGTGSLTTSDMARLGDGYDRYDGTPGRYTVECSIVPVECKLVWRALFSLMISIASGDQNLSSPTSPGIMLRLTVKF